MFVWILILMLILPTVSHAGRLSSSDAGGSVSDTVYGAGWDGDTTVAPSKNTVYDKIETIASGGDNITVNTTAATNANFLDNLYIDWAIDTVATPDDVTSKFNYAETLAGNPALLVDECILFKDATGGGFICEGSTADTSEQLYRLPDVNGVDTTSYFMLDDTSITSIDDVSLEIATGVLRRAALTGDVTASAGNNATTIAVDSVALTTDTTGNYAAGDAEAGNATGLVCTGCVAATDISDGAIDGTELATNTKIVSFGITIDGSGSAVTTGVKGYIEIPFAMTITGWTALSDVSGTCSISVWKDTYVNYPPTVADEISGTEDPAVSAATKGQDLTLTSWTTAVTAGDIIGFNVDSNPCTSTTRLHIIIRGNKT